MARKMFQLFKTCLILSVYYSCVSKHSNIHIAVLYVPMGIIGFFATTFCWQNDATITVLIGQSKKKLREMTAIFTTVHKFYQM